MLPQAGSSCLPSPQSTRPCLGERVRAPTWQPPDEGEHGALQVSPEDGQPLPQPRCAHFPLALGAVHLQRGPVLIHRHSHHVLLAVTDLDLHQDQGDALHGQDDQLWGETQLTGAEGMRGPSCAAKICGPPVGRVAYDQSVTRTRFLHV